MKNIPVIPGFISSGYRLSYAGIITLKYFQIIKQACLEQISKIWLVFFICFLKQLGTQ